MESLNRLELKEELLGRLAESDATALLKLLRIPKTLSRDIRCLKDIMGLMSEKEKAALDGALEGAVDEYLMEREHGKESARTRALNEFISRPPLSTREAGSLP